MHNFTSPCTKCSCLNVMRFSSLLNSCFAGCCSFHETLEFILSSQEGNWVTSYAENSRQTEESVYQSVNYVCSAMDPSEAEFLAEKLLVEIVPNFNFDRVYLISGEIGPFRAGLPVKVPIWLAVNLRQRQKCRILVPEWMDVEKLEQVKEEESASRFFTKMPSEHYMAEAQLILSTCGEDIPRADEIRTALKDLWDMRMSKLRASVDIFIKSGGTHARLDHLTIMELNSVRPLLPHSLDQLHRLRKNTQPRASASQDFSQ